MSGEVNSINVLLVEDDKAVWGPTASRALTSAGMNVTWMTSIGAAADELTDRFSPYHIVVLDRYLPQEEGERAETDSAMALLPHWRKADIDLPVLITSNLQTQEDINAGYYAGAQNYLRKPYEPDELVAVVRAMARGGSRIITSDLVIVGGRPVAQLRGRDLHLSPQAMTLLMTLAAEPKRVFTRAELEVAACEAYGTPGRLYAAVNRLRDELRPHVADPMQVIETVRGGGEPERGYRFNPESLS